MQHIPLQRRASRRPWLPMLALALLTLPLVAGRPRKPAPKPRLFVQESVDPVVKPNGRNPRALGDFDGDGFLDVAASRGRNMSWYRYPSWTRYEIHPKAGRGEQAQASDLDGDGDLDVVVSSFFVSDEDPGWFENPLAGGGDPAVDPWTPHPIGRLGNNGAHDVEPADLDRDGRMDLVMMLGMFFQRDPRAEDVTLAIDAIGGVLANDADPEGAPLTALLVEDASHGALALAPDGSFVYTPEPGFLGTDRFRYRTADDQALSEPAEVRLHVASLGELPPVAADDAYTAPAGSTLVVDTAAGVLQDDADADGDGLSAALVADAGHGSLQLGADGSFIYTPVAGFTGDDRFSYRASDGTYVSTPTTVTLTVVHPDGPIALGDAYAAEADTPLVVDALSGPLANDADPQGLETLSAQLVDDAANGALALSGDGSFTYAPEPGFVGTDGFSYALSDGSYTSNVATVRITVADPAGNLPPTASADDYELAWQLVPSQTLLSERGDKGTAIGDLDLDGDIDIVAPNARAPYEVLWFENPMPDADPATTPWTARSIGPGYRRPSLRVADLDDDGRPDLLVAPAYQLGGLSWFQAPPDPKATGAAWIPHEIDASYGHVHNSGLSAEDVDGDGSLDVVLAEQEESPTGRLAIFYNHGGAERWTEQVLAATGGFAPKVGDVDADGDPDVLNSNTGYWGAPNPLDLWVNTEIPDTTPPVVSTPSLVSGRTTATIFWSSDEPATGSALATSGDVGVFAKESSQVTAHAVVLDGLACDTSYELIASSRDGAGNVANADPMPFATLACGPEQDFAGYWPCDEGMGLVTADASGNGLDGTLDDPLWSTGTGDGSAAALDFSRDRVDIGAPEVAGEAFSIALWFQADDFAGAAQDGRLVSKTSGAEEQDHVWMLGTTRELNRALLRFRLRTNGETTTLQSAFHAALETGVWTHVAAVYDGSEMRIYVDGAEAGTAAKQGPIDAGTGVPAAIGNQPAGMGDFPFDGRIDDVRLYRRALDAGEIAQLASGPASL